uniref:TipJ family phage tail tip protein n=1 Tax=Superficieibacter sp. 1612_C1 TaxID=2780382 RepID=UPI001883E50D
MATIIGAKGGSQKQHTPVEQPDSAQSMARCRMLLALGEGEFAGGLDATRIYLDGTPLGNADGTMNFENVSWDFRPGTQTQEPIPGFPAVENETRLGVSITKATPWTRAISNTQIDAVLVRIGINGLQQQENDGDIVGTTVSYHIDVATDGGSYETVMTKTVTEKLSSLYELTHRINLPKASTGWQIRVVRDTADSTSQLLQNKTQVQAITEVIDARLRYPHTALLYASFNAKTFSDTPKISCKPKGRIIRIPSNYDPIARTYSGTWDGTFKWSWTNNPAWIWFDVLTEQRFGLGRRVTPEMLDKWELYRIAQRCDQRVPDGKGGNGTEPRFIFDVYIQSQADAWQVIKDIAAGFNGMTFWGNNMFNVVSDMPADTSKLQILTRASVVGKPSYSSGSEKNRYSSALINFSDPDNHYQDRTTAVMFPDLVKQFKFKQTQLTAIGCSRESEAQRRGGWAVYSNSLDRIITLQTGLDGFAYIPGTVFAFADERVSGRVYGGRITGYDGSIKAVFTDRGTSAVPGDTLMIRTNGGIVESRTIQAVNGSQLIIATPFKAEPAPNAIFVIDAGQLRLQYFRVTNLTFNDEENTYTITGAEYNASKYDAVDNNARLDIPPISLIPTGLVSQPGDVNVSSYDAVRQGQRVATLVAIWNAPQDKNGKPQADIVAYQMQWKRGDNEWINTPQTGLRSAEVPGIFEGDYLVRVRAINSGGASSLWTTSVLTHLKGRTGAVPAPTGLRTEGIVFGVVLNWDFPAGTGDTLKTEIQYSAASTGENPLLLADVPYPQKTYQQLGLKFGVTFWYRARLVDKNGNQSAWTGWVSGMPADNVADYIDNMDEAIRDTDTYKELDKSIQDNVNAIQKEVSDRSAAITKEATDRAAAISKETTARSQALTKEASDRTAAIAAEATTRAQQDQQVAADAANGLLNEQLTREAAISETNLIIQNKTDSLAQSIAQVAAGSGTQFDSLKIWHFNSSGVEGWTGNGTPTVVDNCLRPANHANNPYVVSPASLAVDAASYRFVKLRIRKVGKPAWRGQLRWRDTAAFNDTNMVTLPEPAFDASGVATIDFSDIKWNTLANVAQIRLDIGATQTASDYFLIDWIAVGRPAPGASTAALEDEATARIAADSAEATARSTLAAQLRGGTDGTDPSKLTSGLIYNERQVRISSEKALAEDVEALETNFNGNKATVQQSLEALTDAQTSQGKAITNISASLKYANIDAANMLTNGSFESDFDYWDDRANRQYQTIINGGSYSGDKILRFSAYPNGTSSVAQRGILLLKGRTYRISAMCRFSADAVDGGTGNTKLALRNNASDGLIAAVAFGANENPLPTSWVERTLDYKVGSSDIVAKIVVGSYMSAGSMDIDFVRVMDITDIKAIETKADAGAVSTLDGKVKAIGDTVDAQGTALTQVQASIGRRTVYRAVSVGSGGTGGIGAAGIFKEDGTKLATPARSYMLSVFRTNADGSTSFTATNFDLYGNAAAASAAFNDAVAALANGTYVAVTTYDEPNGSKSRIYDAIESLGGSREAMNLMVSRSAYILLGCKGIGKGNGQELVSPVGGSADARVFAAIEFVNGTMVGLGAGASAIANANASATTALDAKVTQQGKDISTQADAITQLKTDVGGKASQQALNQLSQRVTDTEGDIESQQTAITGLNNSLKNKADASAFNELETSVKGQSERLDAVETKTVRVDLSALDPDTYYPVTLALANQAQIRQRIRVVRPFNSTSDWTKPVWSTHTNKNFGLTLEWTTIGSGWGANSIDRNIEEFQYTFAAKSPAVGINQMSRSSQEYVYLRGGANYNFILQKSLPDPVIRTTDFTQNDITISPIGLNDPLAIPPTTTRQDTVANATATTALKSTLKDAAADTENMIANGSGESGPEFWEGSPLPAVVTTSPYLGTKCFEYSGTANMLMFQRGLTMLKDRTYRVSLMAKFSSDASVDATTGWGNTKASIRQSESNAFIAEVNFKGSGSSLATVWTEFSFEYTPTADLLVRLAISSLLKAGKMWIDNIRVEDVTDAKANAATATAVSQLQTTVKNQGDTLTAQSQSIQSLNTNLGNKAESSALTQTNATVTQQGKDITANTKSVSELKTRVEGAESGLNQTVESIAQAGFAQFRGFYEQRAEIVSNDTKITASINEVNVTIANEAGAVAQQMNTLQASVGDNAAAIQVTSSALADVSGKLSAQWGVKVQVDAQGRSYAAGIQLGIDGSGGTSAFLIDADQFGIYNPNAAGGRVLAFAVSGATAYLRSAMIQDASIDFAKISDSLQSSNFVDGQTGWRLPKNGAWQVNGSVAGEG